jgi:1-phosphofructokinase
MRLDNKPVRQGEVGSDLQDDVRVCIFSPSPLFTVTIETSSDGEPEVHFHAGGQGFWIARMVNRLGAQALLCAPLGGESGVILRTLIEQEGVALKAISVRGWNGGYVHDRRTGERQTLAEMPSPGLSRHELDDLYDAVLVAGLDAGVAVLTGPAEPRVLPAETYQRLSRDLAENGASVIADLSGEVLRAVSGGIEFLKVSHIELINAGYAEDESSQSLAKGARHLKDASGAGKVIVSRAEQPALALLESRLVEVIAPNFQALDHRGAGDSMTAGLAVGCAKRLDPEATLRLAAAAGALNVTRHGLGTGRWDSIEMIAERIEVRPLPEAS